MSLISVQSSGQRIIKRDHGSNPFKALLNIYKTNPLRHSRVYVNFSNRMLATRSDKARSAMLNFDSNESTRLKEKRTGAKLRRIESIIHSQATSTISSVKGFFVDSSTPETFMTSSIFNEVLNFELYDTGSQVDKGNGKVFVNNVNRKISWDTSLDDAYHERIAPNEWERAKSTLELVPIEIRKIEQRGNHDKDVLVVR